MEELRFMCPQIRVFDMLIPVTGSHLSLPPNPNSGIADSQAGAWLFWAPVCFEDERSDALSQPLQTSVSFQGWPLLWQPVPD